MNRIYAAALMFLLPYFALSQKLIAKNPKVLRGQFLKASHFQAKTVRTEQGIIDGRPEIGQYKPPIPYPELQQKEDGALMPTGPAATLIPSPHITFDGMGYTSVCPADPTMAVSATYVVQMINAGSGAQFQVYDKNGTPFFTKKQIPLLGDKTGMQGLGDCIAIYDQYHDRFILTELSYNDDGLIVAVSQTSDPRGNYYPYFFPLSFSPDYPKYAVWNGVLYAKTNDYQGRTFTGSSVFAIDLPALVNHTTNNPTALEFDLPNTYQSYSACPVGMVGTTPLSNSGGLFAYMADNTWTGSAVDSVGLLELVPDFVNGNGTLTRRDFTVAAYNPGVRSIAQPKGQSLDALADIVMNQPICRAFSSTAASLAMAFTVKVSNKQAGVRWAVLKNMSGTWSLGANGTYAPSDGQNRWIPSVNIDATGNIGLGFNISGSKTYPSIGNIVLSKNGSVYNASSEYLIAAGSASSNCFGRYGDYNHFAIDPSNSSTFWFTAMYNTSPSWSTKIGSFSASTPNPALVLQRNTLTEPTLFSINKTIRAYPNPVNATLTLEFPTDFQGTIQIMDMSGRLVMLKKVSTRQPTFNTSGLNAGVYLLKVTNNQGVDYLKFVKE